MTRFIYAASVVAVGLALAPAAFAKDIVETKTFTKVHGTKVVDRTTLNPKTDVVNEKVTTTRPDGEKKTVDEKISPARDGGFNVSKSTTGFSGDMHSSTSHFGGDKGGKTSKSKA